MIPGRPMQIHTQAFGFTGWAIGLRPDRVCYACMETLGKGRQLDVDGRTFCASCAVQRLTDRNALLDLWRHVREYIRVGLRLRLPPATLHELSPVDLARHLGTDWTGSVDRVLGHTEVSSMRSAILIESGLPIDLASEVLAHEAGHLWYARFGTTGAAESLSEGFPQWVAYGYCQQTGLKHQMRRILRRPGPMGRGARQLVTLQRQHGQGAVIAVAKGRAR